jgi:predicted transcriptional regulator
MEDILFDFRDRDFFRIFTEKRIEMVREIMNEDFNSIRDLAESLERDIKNVWEDLCILNKFGLIEFEIVGRRKIPIVKKTKIIIKLRDVK